MKHCMLIATVAAFALLAVAALFTDRREQFFPPPFLAMFVLIFGPWLVCLPVGVLLGFLGRTDLAVGVAFGGVLLNLIGLGVCFAGAGFHG